MKFNKFFAGLFGVLAMTACSSDEPSVVGGETDNTDNYSDKYISISIEMPASNGGRADDLNSVDHFDNGTANESKVDNIVFFFFDDANKCVDIQKFDNPTFTAPATLNENPFVTRYGTIEVRLKSGLSYSAVAVALNTPASVANDLRNSVTSLETLESRMQDYVKNIKADGSFQIMSNSVYYDMTDGKTNPTADKKILLVKIDENKNVYTLDQRPDIQSLIANGEKEYVDIYVERVAARVDVKASLKMDDFYVYQEGDKKVKTITLFDYTDGGAPKEITVKPVIEGMCLNVLTNKANLVKSLNLDDSGIVGYGTGAGSYKTFQWNDPDNKRSYWGTELGDNMIYRSWNEAANGAQAIDKQYIHPNTQAFLPIANNEENSLNTKVMVVATLYQYDADGNRSEDPIDLAKLGADYMLASSLLAYTANEANNAVRDIDWETTDKLGSTYTEAQRKAIAVAVSKAFATGLTGAKFDIVMDTPASMTDAWNAKVNMAKGVTYDNLYTLEDLDEELVTAAKGIINTLIEDALDHINNQKILYWKGGKTYYYTIIRQQGFNGLVGGGTDNFLNGVVRNHIYNVDLTGIFGLGTPVIDPSKPIDPERPDDEKPSYIQARINVLPWRVVNNSAVIH